LLSEPAKLSTFLGGEVVVVGIGGGGSSQNAVERAHLDTIGQRRNVDLDDGLGTWNRWIDARVVDPVQICTGRQIDCLNLPVCPCPKGVWVG
jgi:tRNA A37 threonylcarbamoyladenosine dehydratase